MESGGLQVVQRSVTPLRRKTASAAAGFDCVGVFEREPAFFEPAVEVDFRAVEEQVALLVDDNADTVIFGKNVC